jgi:hypothetical protein
MTALRLPVVRLPGFEYFANLRTLRRLLPRLTCAGSQREPMAPNAEIVLTEVVERCLSGGNPLDDPASVSELLRNMAETKERFFSLLVQARASTGWEARTALRAAREAYCRYGQLLKNLEKLDRHRRLPKRRKKIRLHRHVAVRKLHNRVVRVRTTF